MLSVHSVPVCQYSQMYCGLMLLLITKLVTPTCNVYSDFCNLFNSHFISCYLLKSCLYDASRAYCC